MRNYSQKNSVLIIQIQQIKTGILFYYRVEMKNQGAEKISANCFPRPVNLFTG
jgi:hypothetical protein